MNETKLEWLKGWCREVFSQMIQWSYCTYMVFKHNQHANDSQISITIFDIPSELLIFNCLLVNSTWLSNKHLILVCPNLSFWFISKKILPVLEFLPHISRWRPVAQVNVRSLPDSSLSHTSHSQTHQWVQSARSKINWDSFSAPCTQPPQ